MDILPSNLVSLGGRYYDKGKQGALYSRLTKLELFSGRLKEARNPEKKKEQAWE